MFRFTIRDVLWLMVVAGLAAGWACSGMPEAERLQRENSDLEGCLVDLARKWAKEKGEPVYFETAEKHMEAEPNGDVTIFSQAIEPTSKQDSPNR